MNIETIGITILVIVFVILYTGAILLLIYGGRKIKTKPITKADIIDPEVIDILRVIQKGLNEIGYKFGDADVEDANNKYTAHCMPFSHWIKSYDDNGIVEYTTDEIRIICKSKLHKDLLGRYDRIHQDNKELLMRGFLDQFNSSSI